MAHTPGPWHDEFDRVCKAQDEICSVSFRSGRAQENHANARLIAAAPDLLAACEELLSVLENWGVLLAGRDNPSTTEVTIRFNAGAILSGLKSLIAKAKGE